MIVLHSTALLAFLNRRDPQHARALETFRLLADGRWGKGLLVESVFAETVTIIKKRVSYAAAVQAGEVIRRSRQLEIVPGADLFLEAWRQFQADALSPLTFADHSMVILARRRSAGKILTFDEAFSAIPGIHPEPNDPGARTF